METNDKPYIDLGYFEGALANGRPYRAEVWTEYGLASVTCFCERREDEVLSKLEAADLLEGSGLIFFESEARRSAYPVAISDSVGMPCWSINAILWDGGGETSHARLLVDVQTHAK